MFWISFTMLLGLGTITCMRQLRINVVSCPILRFFFLFFDRAMFVYPGPVLGGHRPSMGRKTSEPVASRTSMLPNEKTSKSFEKLALCRNRRKARPIGSCAFFREIKRIAGRFSLGWFSISTRTRNRRLPAYRRTAGRVERYVNKCCTSSF